MSDMAFAAAIRPKVYGSSTIGVKKSIVVTRAMSSEIRHTAASSSDSLPTSSSGGRAAAGIAASTSESEPAGSLHAHPAPWESSVSRIWVATGAAYRGDPAPGLFREGSRRLLLEQVLAAVQAPCDLERLALRTRGGRVRSQVSGGGYQRQLRPIRAGQQPVLRDGGLDALDGVEVAVLAQQRAAERRHQPVAIALGQVVH